MSIKGMNLGSTQCKLAAYADDHLFFLAHPHQTVPNLLKEFDLYGSFSILKVNYPKSEALNISLTTKNLQDTQLNCPFKWVLSALKYLGIRLTPNVADLYTQNFKPILQKL